MFLFFVSVFSHDVLRGVTMARVTGIAERGEHFVLLSTMVTVTVMTGIGEHIVLLFDCV